MYAHEGAKKFCEKFNIVSREIEWECSKIIELEATEILYMFKGKRNKWELAIDTAYDEICQWFKATDFNVDFDNIQDLRRFIGSHRKACIWANFLRRELVEKHLLDSAVSK